MKLTIESINKLAQEGLGIENRFQELAKQKLIAEQGIKEHVEKLTGKKVDIFGNIDQRKIRVNNKEYSFNSAVQIVQDFISTRKMLVVNINNAIKEFQANIRWDEENDTLVVNALGAELFTVNLKTLALVGLKFAGVSFDVANKIQPFLKQL